MVLNKYVMVVLNKIVHFISLNSNPMKDTTEVKPVLNAPVSATMEEPTDAAPISTADKAEAKAKSLEALKEEKPVVNPAEVMKAEAADKAAKVKAAKEAHAEKVRQLDEEQRAKGLNI